MTDIKLSKSDIDNLAGKLDELGEVLNNNEKSLLLAVFGLASNALGHTISQSESGISSARVASGLSNPTLVRSTSATLPKLSDGFKDAFNPGQAGRFSVPGEEVMDSVSVGGGCVTWSKDLKLPSGDRQLEILKLEEQMQSLQTQISALKGIR
jgi:hypothetical protein